MIIDDNGPLQNGGIGQDEIAKFGNRHIVEVDIILHHDLGTGRDDVIGPILAFGNHLLDVLLGKVGAENRFRDIRDLIVVEPFLHLAARGTTRGGVDFNHGTNDTPFVKQR